MRQGSAFGPLLQRRLEKRDVNANKKKAARGCRGGFPRLNIKVDIRYSAAQTKASSLLDPRRRMKRRQLHISVPQLSRQKRFCLTAMALLGRVVARPTGNLIFRIKRLPRPYMVANEGERTNG